MCFLLFYLGLIIVSLLSNSAPVSAYEINLQCDEKVFYGASPKCQASVYDGNELASGQFYFNWHDNAIPMHAFEEKTNSTSKWNIPFEQKDMGPGWYVVRVEVCHYTMWFSYCKDLGSVGTTIIATDFLNGQINITQYNETRENDFVSTNGTALHHVALDRADMDYVAKAPTVLTYWFVDCVYYGLGDLSYFPFNYTKPDEDHMIETLVVADFTPLPPTTTTSKPTTTTKATTIKPTTTTSKTTTTTTTKKPNNSSSVPSKQKRSIDNVIHKESDSSTMKNAAHVSNGTVTNQTQHIMVWQNGTLVRYNGSFPIVCGGAAVASDHKKVYGYFRRNVTVKAPVSNLTIKGNNWLQRGDLLDIEVKCQGSNSMQYCVKFYKGVYNMTGNETCSIYNKLDVCDFPIKRYLQPSFEKHTVVIIVKNDVGKIVTPVTVTYYQVKAQAQLSVIVVPVAFTLMAVVLVVFGVAYYFQNRSRFVVEVADFDFGQQYADMDYKTFRERLRDSVMNAFTRDPIPSTSDVSQWPPGHKYGSMT